MVASRLKEIRKDLGYTQKDFSKLINIANTTYCNYENGVSSPPIDLQAKLAETFDVSINWLITGKGSKYLVTEEKQAAARPSLDSLLATREDLATVEEKLEAKISSLADKEDLEELREADKAKADKKDVERENHALRRELEKLRSYVYEQLPPDGEEPEGEEPEGEEPEEVRDIEITYLGRHSAAGKAFSPDNYESMVRIPESFLPADKTDLFTGKIEGTSMGDIIPDGSYVLLRHMQTPIPISGRVYVFTWNGENTIKKFRLSEYGPQFLFLDGSGRIITPKENEVWTCQAEFVCVIPADKIKF